MADLDIGYVLPLTNEYFQQFSCTFPIDNRNIRLDFTMRYNHIAKYWFMSIADSKTGTLLLDSIPLFESDGASSDIMFQYAYMEVGSAFVVRIGPRNIYIDRPDDTNLDTDYQILWSDTV